MRSHWIARLTAVPLAAAPVAAGIPAAGSATAATSTRPAIAAPRVRLPATATAEDGSGDDRARRPTGRRDDPRPPAADPARPRLAPGAGRNLCPGCLGRSRAGDHYHEPDCQGRCRPTHLRAGDSGAPARRRTGVRRGRHDPRLARRRLSASQGPAGCACPAPAGRAPAGPGRSGHPRRDVPAARTAARHRGLDLPSRLVRPGQPGRPRHPAAAVGSCSSPPPRSVLPRSPRTSWLPRPTAASRRTTTPSVSRHRSRRSVLCGPSR